MFKTKDFYLSSVLLLSGYEIVTHEKEQGKFIFSFNDTEELKDAVKDYYYDRITVSPQKYQAAIKSLKNIIYN